MNDDVRKLMGGIMQDQQSKPLVSIGLPVYNGENYLEETICSILGQTFPALELIICDNASTDSTGLICQKYAQQDPRVRYYRNRTNIGGGANYDLCFEKSQSRYFKWSAHDDLLDREYLSKTIAALEADPGAIRCVTGVREVDHYGE